MPPHQLYLSVHSCHLDHFLSQVLYHPCRELPVACCPDTIKAEIAFSRPCSSFFFFLKNEATGQMQRHSTPPSQNEQNTDAFWLYVSGILNRPARCPPCGQLPANTLHSICCCCCCCASRKRSESKRGEKKSTRSCPLDCTEIKVTVCVCLQAGDITVYS